MHKNLNEISALYNYRLGRSFKATSPFYNCATAIEVNKCFFPHFSFVNNLRVKSDGELSEFRNLNISNLVDYKP